MKSIVTIYGHLYNGGKANLYKGIVRHTHWSSYVFLWDLKFFGFWDFGFLGFWDFGIMGFWVFGFLSFSDFGILGFWDYGFLGL